MRWRNAVWAAIVPLALTGFLVPSTAQAATATALQKCQAGAAPDVTETVFHPGTQTQVTFPKAVPDPDNGIYPGDVVRISVTGTLRYDVTRTTGPAGTGTPDANGIRPFASTTTWNNNSGGWVGNEVSTTSLDSCVAAPTLPVRAIFRIKDANLADNSGGYTITTKLWRAPGRLVIDGTEVTQGIQTPNQEVPLIAGKRTFLRVFIHHVDDGLGPMTGVSASLTIPGTTGTYYPLASNDVTSLTTGSDRRTLTNSFIFELPASATGQGVRSAVVSVRPPASRGGSSPTVKSVPLSFGPSTSLTVYGIRYSYFNIPREMYDQLKATQPGLGSTFDGWWKARQLSDWEPLRRMAENALPLAKLNIPDDAPAGTPYSEWGNHWVDCKGAKNAAGKWQCGGYLDGRKLGEDFIDAKCPNGGCRVMVLQPEIDYNHEDGAHYKSPKQNHVMNMQGEAEPGSQGNTLAHEIGHSLGLPHTWDDTNYPRSDGALGNFVAVRYAPTLALVPGTTTTGTTASYDLMSYSRPAWFSPHNYCAAMAKLPGSHPLCAPGFVG
jgi:Metallo-peptidase family M12B Reprolysin-like